MGEVVQDGETVLRYLWSADLTVLNSSRPGLSEALAAAEHTGYDALLAACTDAQTEPVKGIAVCSDPAWTAKMDAGWTDAKNAAALYAPEAAVTAAEPVPLYNADAGFRAAVDAQELERTAEVSTLVPNEKRVIFYTDVNSVNSVCYTVEDGVLIKYVDTDITYSCEAVTVIYTRAELGSQAGDGLPCDGKSCPGKVFADMPPKGNWAHDAIDWAVVKKITSGTSANAFSPNNGCTRAQVVTFLWLAAGEPAPKGSANPFADVKPGTYYYNAVLWAVENKITSGTSANAFSPDATCTRAQIVTFLWRFEGEPAAASAVNPFADVKAGVYYEKAVLWAAGAGVTSGTSANAFSPDNTCTRAQVVTFLYRDVVK